MNLIDHSRIENSRPVVYLRLLSLLTPSKFSVDTSKLESERRDTTERDGTLAPSLVLHILTLSLHR